MNLEGMRRVRHNPPKGAKITRVDKNRRAIGTCASGTKKWVTRTNYDCLELAKNATNRKAG